MIRYVLKRIVWLIPVIIAVSFIVFSLMELAPGTVIDAIITGEMSEDEIAAIKRQHNLDRPMIYRYGLYMLNLIQGDLGVSDHTQLSVWNTYITRLPNTLILSFLSVVIGSIVAVPMGMFAARYAGKIADNVTTTFSLIGMSMPAFWLGLLLILVFSSWLGWLPTGGNNDGARSLVLPAICSSFTLMAMGTRQTRSSMLEVLRADYLRTARAKGVPEKTVIRKHALGNAWIPIITSMGNALSMSLAGSVVVESVFAWPGIGRMAAEAVMARDVTATTGIVILTTILFVMVQLVVDLMYAFVDPRIKAKYMSVGKRKKKAKVTAQKTASARTQRSNVHAQAAVKEAERLEARKDVDADDAPVAQTTPISEIVASDSHYDHRISVAESKDTMDKADAGAAGDEAELAGSSVTCESYQLASKKYKRRSQIGEIFHSLRKNKGAMAGFSILCFLFAILIASFFINNDAVFAMSARSRLAPPSLQYLFGADNFGRNMLLRVIFGTRYSIAIGFGAVSFAVFFGVSLGSFAGYYGGRVEDLIMRASDVLSSIPGILLGMVIMTVLGHGLQNLIIAVGVSSIPGFIRITRASIISVRNQEFVEAALAVGIPNVRIIFTQVLTNGLSPIIVTTTGSLGMSILVASSLSFLGFGVPIATPEWGALIASGREFAGIAPWLMFFPGIFIMMTVLAFNLLGDGLRDALDPKLKTR